MKAWPAHPVIYEINTWVWLAELSRRYRRGVDLGSVPPDEWDILATGGFDAVWFMGVWERSPGWCWVQGDARFLILINFRDAGVQARVHLPWDELRGRSWRLADLLSDEVYDREGTEMRDAGLYVDLAPWKCNLFQMSPDGPNWKRSN